MKTKQNIKVIAPIKLPRITHLLTIVHEITIVTWRKTTQNEERKLPSKSIKPPPPKQLLGSDIEID